MVEVGRLREVPGLTAEEKQRIGDGGRGGGEAAAIKKPSVYGKGEGGKKYMGGPFVPGEATTQDKRPFYPGWWLHPGQKAPPFCPG